MFEEIEINDVCCPHCSAKMKLRLSQVLNQERVTCAACGKGVELSADNAGEAQQELGKLKQQARRHGRRQHHVHHLAQAGTLLKA